MMPDDMRKAPLLEYAAISQVRPDWVARWLVCLLVWLGATWLSIFVLAITADEPDSEILNRVLLLPSIVVWPISVFYEYVLIGGGIERYTGTELALLVGTIISAMLWSSLVLLVWRGARAMMSRSGAVGAPRSRG